MSYEKYTWQTGEVITADKLNHMEEGIKNSYQTVFPAEFRESDNKLLVTASNGDIKVGDAFNIEWSEDSSTGNTFGYCMETALFNGINSARFIYIVTESGTLKITELVYDAEAGGYLEYSIG